MYAEQLGAPLGARPRVGTRAETLRTLLHCLRQSWDVRLSALGHTWGAGGGAATQPSRDHLRDCKGPDQEEDLGASPHPATDEACNLGTAPEPSELSSYFHTRGFH